MTDKSRRFEDIGFYLVVVAGLIAIDFFKGPIFPDPVYCLVSAGTEITYGSETRANSWRASDGCQAYDNRCANSWVTTPGGSYCIHKTLVDGWSAKLGINKTD